MTIEELKKFLADSERSNTGAQTATGNYIGGQHFGGGGSCPSCGHYPHCGRGGFQATPYYPSYPQITWGGTMGRTTC